MTTQVNNYDVKLTCLWLCFLQHEMNKTLTIQGPLFNTHKDVGHLFYIDLLVPDLHGTTQANNYDVKLTS